MFYHQATYSIVLASLCRGVQTVKDKIKKSKIKKAVDKCAYFVTEERLLNVGYF